MKKSTNIVCFFCFFISLAGCNKINYHVKKKKFNVVSPRKEWGKKEKLLKSVEEDLSLDRALNTIGNNSYNTGCSSIIFYGNFEDIQTILGKKRWYNHKEKITLALLIKLFLSQKKEGWWWNWWNCTYTYDKSLAEKIEKYGHIRIYKNKPNEKDIYYIDDQGKGYKLNNISIPYVNDATRANWAIYAKALAQLITYHRGDPFSTADIKDAFLGVIKLVNEEEAHFTRLFIDYTDIIKSVDTSILEEIQKHNFFKSSIIYSLFTTTFLYHINELEDAKHYCHIAGNLLQEAYDNGSLSQHDIDLGVSLKEFAMEHNRYSGRIMLRENRYQEAELHFSKIYANDPDDEECIMSLLHIHEGLENNKKVMDLVDNHNYLLPYMDIKQQIMHRSTYPHFEELKNLSYPDMATIIVTAYLNCSTKEQASYYRDILERKIMRDPQFKTLRGVDQIQAKLIHSSNNIYNSIIQKQLSGLSKTARFDVLHRTSFIYAASGDYQPALKCIEIARRYDANHPCLIRQAAILNNALRVSALQAQESTFLLNAEMAGEKLSCPSEKTKDKIKTRKTSDRDDMLPSDDNLSETDDPQTIHRYYQRAKIKILDNEFNPNKSKEIGWLLHEGTPIPFAEAIQIERYDRLFAAIHPKLAHQLGNSLPRWKEIVSKGLIYTGRGVSGIKLLPNKIYAAKDTTKDPRLVASKIYVNDAEQELIVFDEQCLHRQLPDYITTHHQKKILCRNYPKDE